MSARPQSDTPDNDARQARERTAPPTRVPRATYRLQFHHGFTFDDAIEILPYLAELGISHIYCSPIQRARAGSMHGYDVVAHDEINPELGGMPAFERFTAALKKLDMGQLLDLVPNHMGVLCADNPWWMDVLEDGAASVFAQYFDIDWEPLNHELFGKVLVPVLSDQYGDVLDRGELQLRWEGACGELALHYREHRFPLAPSTYPLLLERAVKHLTDPKVASGLSRLSAAFRKLQRRGAALRDSIAQQARDKQMLKARLKGSVAAEPSVDQAIARAVSQINAPDERDVLHALLEEQAYRLAYWRVAADEINYRRFFDNNDLAALRVEREEVFDATHALALDLAARGWVDGLRIDHPDGLLDPAGYFDRLQQGYAQRTGLALPSQADNVRPVRPLYVVAEKIAAPGEQVPESWAVHGTTGYRFANVANAVLVEGRAAARMRRIWHTFTGEAETYPDVSYHAKRAVARGALSSDLTVLATELLRIARSNRRTRDYTLNTLRLVLSEVVACLPVYRTYIAQGPSAQDVDFIDSAIQTARRRSRAADTAVFAFVREALLGRPIEPTQPGAKERVLRFAARFQQFSAPVAAKGVEDTAFNRFFPLSSLNEIGGDPDGFGMTVEQYHEASADRALRWPHTMLATSTHASKRSEDVRSRINVLSEMTGRWRFALRRWQALNRAARPSSKEADADALPSAAHEYLFYQTVLGTIAPDATNAQHAAYVDRIVAYLRDAAREGKVHTSSSEPNDRYESALENFVRGTLAVREPNRFLAELRHFAGTVRWYGALNSFTLVLLKYCSPGVPNLYQGNEFFDDSLMDPDNRRPVDFARRALVLQELKLAAVLPAEALGPRLAQWATTPEDGHAKMWLTWRLLARRRAMPALFRDGSYVRLEVAGPNASHLVAFMRRHEDVCLLVIAVRLFATLDGHGDYSITPSPHADITRSVPVGDALWRGTTVALPQALKAGHFKNCLTDAVCHAQHGRLAVNELFAHFPGAVLISRALAA